MTIRLATDQDWPSIYPFYAASMAEGKTCARDVDYLGPGCHHLGGNIAAVFETSFSRPAWHGSDERRILMRPGQARWSR